MSCWRRALRSLEDLASVERPRRQRRERAAGPGRRESASGSWLGAVQILPLGCYLARSPVWGDRRRETQALVELVAAAAARRGVHGLALCVRQPAAGPSQPGAGARESTTSTSRPAATRGWPRSSGWRPLGVREPRHGPPRSLPGRSRRCRAPWAPSGSPRSTTCSAPCRSSR